MIYALRFILAVALAFLPLADAARAAVVQIQAKDQGGTARSFNVTTNSDLTGNLLWNNVICGQGAGTTCVDAGAAGSPGTNALTVQALTLGHGTAANAMRVELPTDGTGLVNAAQSGTWNITNISGTVSLPTGASTAAKQPALGTAGTASTDVITVQGIASMTPLLASISQGGNTAGVDAGTSSLKVQIQSGGALNGNGQQPSNASAPITLPTDQTCNSHVFKHITSATDTLAVQGVTAQTIRICGYKATFAGTNAVFLENTASTNANCSSSNTQITGQDSGVAQAAYGFYSGVWAGVANTSGNGLCINSTGTGAVDVDIWYRQS